MAKNALVISGGGAKGAFAVGVLKYIMTQTLVKFDIVCGTSTGSLITPFAALGELDTLEEVYTTTTTKDVLLKGDVGKRFLKNNSLFDATPLANLVKKHYTQDLYDRLAASDTSVFFATVCLQTGQIVHFSNRDVPTPDGYEVMKLRDHDEFIRAIMASSMQPIFMQPIKIRSTDANPRQYVDGGVREYAPAQVAIDNGATDVYIIYLSPKDLKLVNEEYTGMMDILTRTLALFLEDVGENDVAIPQLYNRSVLYLNDVKAKMFDAGLPVAQINGFFDTASNPLREKKILKLHVFHPEYLLNGPGGLEFEPAEMKKYLDHGFDVAKKYFDSTAAVIV